MQSVEFDRIDLKILAFLQEHGRASNLELAEAVSLSASQCHRRHKRLEELGVIAGYEARLAPAALGLGVVAFVHVAMEKGHFANIRKFTESVRNLPQVLECFSVTGDFDYVLKIVASDLKAMSQFLMDTLIPLPGVANVRSSVCLDEIKSTGALPLPRG